MPTPSLSDRFITLFQPKTAMATRVQFSVEQMESHLAPVARTLTVPILVHPGVHAASEHVGVDLADDTQGFYVDGQIHLIANNHRSMADAESTIWHEVQHAGVDRTYRGDSAPYHETMTRLYERNAPLRTRADHWAQAHRAELTEIFSAAGMDAAKIPQAIRSRSVEEILSEMSEEQGASRLSGLREFAFGITQTLRAMKLNKLANAVEGVTDAEAMHVLHQTRATVLQQTAPLQASRTPAQHRMQVEQRALQHRALPLDDIETAMLQGQSGSSPGFKM